MLGLLRWTFASVVGNMKFWVHELFSVRDLNQQMRPVFGFGLLETVLMLIALL